VIQLGAILRLSRFYFFKLMAVRARMFSNPDDRRFVTGLLVAFLPAAVIGAAAGGLHQGIFVQSVGGVLSLISAGHLLWVDQLFLNRTTRCHDISAADVSHDRPCAVLAMIPGGVTFSASIVAAMLLGADKRAAAEFSFFPRIPTMVGAFALRPLQETAPT